MYWKSWKNDRFDDCNAVNGTWITTHFWTTSSINPYERWPKQWRHRLNTFRSFIDFSKIWIFKLYSLTFTELIIFMTMMSQQKSCLPTEPIIIDKPAPPIEVIYRTFAIDPVTGKRTLISESNDPSEYNWFFFNDLNNRKSVINAQLIST